MKKALIVIILIFILTSILTFNFTLQAAQNFQDFDDDDNGDDDDDSVVPQIILDESVIPTNGTIMEYDFLVLNGLFILLIIELIYQINFKK
jgi:hypothetical protein